ncbi:MAG: exported protein of unknown function, partial [Candidatus Saccharibacteria bacterium]|nr:exported protein of unknown function [Candidatus Saccharibacteria bacterium]
MFSMFVSMFAPHPVSADQISVRSLTLQAHGPTTDGGSKRSGVVDHEFAFTVPNVGAPAIGSIEFKYCTLAAGICTMPAGLHTDTFGSGTTMGTQTGATGFTLVNTTNGAPYITRTAASISAGSALTYEILGVTNPDATDCPLNNPSP